MRTIFIIIICLLMLHGCAQAQEFSDIKIVNAIYLAEGGSHAKFSYGIRSVHYSSLGKARKICLNTVRNNRRRYKEYGYRNYPNFIQFLGSRFCPTKDRNLSKSEKRLNQYWIKNVTYFLQEGI